MCRWLAYMGEEVFLDELLFETEHSLVEQSLHSTHGHVTTNGDGFGLGWYGARDEPGLYREVLPAWNDSNLRNLARQIQSSFFMAHVRASTGTETSRVNCHPFRHGRWLFMHNGMIGGYARVRRRLEALIPDAVYTERRGTTDSELFFYLLSRHGLDDDPAAALEATVAEVTGVMADAGVADPFRMTAMLSDGETGYALRYSNNPEPPSLYWQARKGHLIVVSEPLDDDAIDWETVPPNHLLVTGGGGDTALQPFEPRMP